MSNKYLGIFKPYVNRKAITYVNKVLKSGWIGEGPYVRQFENKIGQIIQNPNVVTLNSGTSSLHMALVVAGVGPGDEVITTAQTMMATSTAILQTGATPVFADIEYVTGNIDANDIEHRITKRTKAILMVHWGGYPCDIAAITKIAKKHKLVVIEDAAHALGSVYKNKMIGQISDLTCFSFQAIKMITTGDGGAISCKNNRDFKLAKRLKWFGIDRDLRKQSELGEPYFDVKELGFKYHMNDISAAIGLGNLTDFKKLLHQKHKIAEKYNKAFQNIPGITLHQYQKDRKSAYWLYLIHVENRLQFIRKLKSHNIEASVVHMRIDQNSLFKSCNHDLPQLDKYNSTHVALPIHNLVSIKDSERVIQVVKSGW